jgi:hypothetical protein
MTQPLFIAAERVSSAENPLDRGLVHEVGYAEGRDLVFNLARGGYSREDDLQLFQCVPLTPAEEKALWDDLEARQIVCKHYRPAPGHPDWSPDTACVNCLAENAKWDAVDRAYDRLRGK